MSKIAIEFDDREIYWLRIMCKWVAAKENCFKNKEKSSYKFWMNICERLEKAERILFDGEN